MPKGGGPPRQSPKTSSTHLSSEDLFNEILTLARELVARDPNLFRTLVAHVQEMAPREPSPVRRAAGAEQKGVQANGTRKNPTTFHKYTLPGDKGAQEFYECMTCHERRVTNSFHSDHQEKHKGEKFQVRWYCPICDTHFAVTHRGYHIKNRHGSEDEQGGRKRSSRGRPRNDSEINDNDEGDYPGYIDDSSPQQKRKRVSSEEGGTSVESSPEKKDAVKDLISISRQNSVILTDPHPGTGQYPPVIQNMPAEMPGEYPGVAPPPPRMYPGQPIPFGNQFGRQPSLLPRSDSGSIQQTYETMNGAMPMPVSNRIQRTPTEEALGAVSELTGSGGASSGIGTFTASESLTNLGLSAGILPSTGSLTGGLGSLLGPGSGGATAATAAATAAPGMMFPGNSATITKVQDLPVKPESKS